MGEEAGKPGPSNWASPTGKARWDLITAWTAILTFLAFAAIASASWVWDWSPRAIREAMIGTVVVEVLAIVGGLLWFQAKLDGYREGEAASGTAAAIAGTAEGYDARRPSLHAPDARQSLGIYQRRRRLGYVLGAASILLLIATIVGSLWSLHVLRPPDNPLQEKYSIALLITHAIATVAAVYFCYQLLRAAERMAIPAWWLTDHLDSAKVVLGVEDPVSATSKTLEKLLEAYKKTNDLIKSVVSPEKEK